MTIVRPLAALALAHSACALNVASPLPPLAWAPLPHGTLQPEGWIFRQLKIQGDGLSGQFEKFWEPVANAQWTGGTSTQEGKSRVALRNLCVCNRTY